MKRCVVKKIGAILFLFLLISGCGITPATESGDMGFAVVGKGETLQGQNTISVFELTDDKELVGYILDSCKNLKMKDDIQLRIPTGEREVYCFTAVRPENPDMQDYYDGFMELYGEFFPGRELNEEFLYYMGGSSEVIRDDSGKIIRDLYRVKDWKKKILSGKEKGIWFLYDESWHRVITEWEDCVCLEMGCPVGYGYTVLNKGKTLELSGTKITDYGSDTERYPGLEGYDPSDYLDYVGTYHRDSTVSFRLADREVPICEAVEYFEEYINGLPYPKDANAKTVVLDVDVYHVTGEIYGYNLITTKQYQGVDYDQMKPGTYDFILSDYAPLGGYAFMVESKDVDLLYGYYRMESTENAVAYEEVVGLESVAKRVSEEMSKEVVFEVERIDMVYTRIPKKTEQGYVDIENPSEEGSPSWKFTLFNPNNSTRYFVYVDALTGGNFRYYYQAVKWESQE